MKRAALLIVVVLPGLACTANTAPAPQVHSTAVHTERVPVAPAPGDPEPGDPKPGDAKTGDPESAWPDYDCEALERRREMAALDTDGLEEDEDEDSDAEADTEADAEEPVPSAKLGPLAELVADLTVAVDGEVFVSDGVQCSAFPGRGDEEAMVNRASVRAIGPAGVRKVALRVPPGSIPFDPPPEGKRRFELVARHAEPSPTAHLDLQELQPCGPEGAVADAWIESRETVPYEPVGTLTGSFGGGVDRFVVVKPTSIYPPSKDSEPLPEPDYCTTEFVVALAQGSVRGVLPLTREPGLKTRELCSCDELDELSIDGIDVAGLVDLDGDGVQEVVWVFQNMGGDLVTRIAITYFSGGEFADASLASCSYNGCDRFLGAARCGSPAVAKDG